jgi:hypothetical protein
MQRAEQPPVSESSAAAKAIEDKAKRKFPN